MSLSPSTNLAFEHHDMDTEVVLSTPPLPQTTNVIDPDVLRTTANWPSSSGSRSRARMACPARYDADPLHQFGEGDREDESHSERWHMARYASTSVTGVDVEGRPLIDALDDEVDVRGKPVKVRQSLSRSIPFRRRKAEKSGPPTFFGPVMRRSLVAESATRAQNPFGDEHAIERDAGDDRGGKLGEDEQMETHDEPFPTPSTPSGQWVTFPPSHPKKRSLRQQHRSGLPGA